MIGAEALATTIALVAVKLLNAFWARKDITDAARYRVLQEQQPAKDAAKLWLDTVRLDPQRAAALGVLSGAQGLRLVHPSDPTSGSSPDRSM